GATELTSADTDMRLRSLIQQTLDTLALSAVEPESRRAAALKLGNSKKPRYVPVLQGRLDKESNLEVRKALEEGIALLQLGSDDVKTQTAAVRRLGQIQAIGCLEPLKGLLAKPGCPAEVTAAAKSSIKAIEEHIWWVNFFG